MTTMKLNDVFGLFGAIQNCQQQLSGQNLPVQFSYCLAKNLRILEPEIKSAQDSVTKDIDPELLKTYEKEQMDLMRKWAKKDASGNPVLHNGAGFQFNSPEDMAQVNIQLEETFPEAVEAFKLQQTRSEELSKQEVEIKLFTLPLDKWPDLSPIVLNGLYPLIKDDDAAVK